MTLSEIEAVNKEEIKTTIWEMSNEQILNVIRQSGFSLYGNFRKEEKKKLIGAFKALGAEKGRDYSLTLGNNSWGNRQLTVTLFNPAVPDSFWYTGDDDNEDDDDDVIRYVRLAY